ncbi:glycosyltransferase [Dactylosporangium sp. AC04546]|uniref:glycosyltransferase n=1 Tax=Dactylosporangium sp. AC04546 TaxID=2862460 RepID=UPI001EE00E8D|nr:glycosyltransferase [Dactylosporangium sp. AC04546]WVK82639.1 glycosyltransferase [Dactylosporangium sp. AC04546]
MTATMPAIATGRLLIPRVFHRIWFGGPMPGRERAFGETWLRHHPGWELRLWGDDDVPPLVNQAAFDAAGSWAQKADIFRYELLLAHGGVYLDTDFECVRSIEPLLTGVEAVTAREDGFRASIGLLGCVPGHPFFAAVVAGLADSLAWRPGRPPNEQTGPELFTRTLIEQDALGHPVPVVFGPELFYPYHWTEPHRAGQTFPDAYAVHHWAKSWQPPAASGAAVPAPEVVPVSETSSRLVVTIDADLLESAAVVLAGALEVAAAVPQAELALVVQGAPEATEAVGDAIAGVVRQLAGDRDLPDIVVYGEPEGAALPALARVELGGSPAENARALLTLAAAARPSDVDALRTAEPVAVYVGGGRILVRTTGGDRLYCDGADVTQTPALVLDGAAEPDLTRYAGSRLGPGDTAVDVGAGIGAVTVRLARAVGATGRVVAYETDPARLALLRDNVAANGLGDVVAIRAQAGPGADVLSPAPRLIRAAGPAALESLRPWLAAASGTAVTVPAGAAAQVAGFVAEGWRVSVLRADGSTAPAEVMDLPATGTLVLER